jgi:IS5 family transposase
MSRIRDETTILRFRRLLEAHQLANVMFVALTTIPKGRSLVLRAGTAIDTILIAAPGSNNKEDGERDPAIHQTQKCAKYYSGMKAHIDVHTQSGLFRTVKGAAAKAHDATKALICCMAKKRQSLATWIIKKPPGDPKLQEYNGK